MTQLFLLVIISVTQAGDLSSAFVGTQTLAQCEERAKAIRSILDTGKVELKEFACLPSTQRFELFQHGTAPDAARHIYRVTLGADSARIGASPSMEACRGMSTPAETAGLRSYCTSSTQAMLGKAE